MPQIIHSLKTEQRLSEPPAGSLGIQVSIVIGLARQLTYPAAEMYEQLLERPPMNQYHCPEYRPIRRHTKPVGTSPAPRESSQQPRLKLLSQRDFLWLEEEFGSSLYRPLPLPI